MYTAVPCTLPSLSLPEATTAAAERQTSFLRRLCARAARLTVIRLTARYTHSSCRPCPCPLMHSGRPLIPAPTGRPRSVTAAFLCPAVLQRGWYMGGIRPPTSPAMIRGRFAGRPDVRPDGAVLPLGYNICKHMPHRLRMHSGRAFRFGMPDIRGALLCSSGHLCMVIGHSCRID